MAITREEVANQGKFFLTSFIHDRAERERSENAQQIDLDVPEPTKPRGPSLEFVREFRRAIQITADEMDKEKRLQELISKVPPDANERVLKKVSKSLFDDGDYNWGKIIALFCLAYKLCVKAVGRILDIIDTIVDFFRDNVAWWICEQGGWESFFGMPSTKFAVVFGAGIAACAVVYIYNKFLS